MTTAEETERLRRAIGRLEAENAALEQRTAAVVEAETRQARALDELGLDLNALLRRRGAQEVRATLRAVRRAYWLVRYRPLRWVQRQLGDRRN